jgi:hypothetical protein
MQRVLAAVLLLTACKKSPARYCDQDLSGVWLNASDRHFAYRFRDHGDVVRGEFFENQEDGGLTRPDEPILFELHRTEKALAGVMRAKEGGCDVDFGVDVTSCAKESMQAEVETEVPVGPDCKRRTAEDGGELAPHRTEYVFVRGTQHW